LKRSKYEECEIFHRSLKKKEEAEQAWKNSREKFDLEEEFKEKQIKT